MLTGFVIDVYRDTDETFEEDIYLDEFKDEIEEWIIDALKDMGCVTAKSVLNTPRADLINKADLEEETVDNVRPRLPHHRLMPLPRNRLPKQKPLPMKPRKTSLPRNNPNPNSKKKRAASPMPPLSTQPF